jgi:hypothetical protein
VCRLCDQHSTPQENAHDHAYKHAHVLTRFPIFDVCESGRLHCVHCLHCLHCLHCCYTLCDRLHGAFARVHALRDYLHCANHTLCKLCNPRQEPLCGFHGPPQLCFCCFCRLCHFCVLCLVSCVLCLVFAQMKNENEKMKRCICTGASQSGQGRAVQKHARF